jgi:hypothetical protein
MRSFREDSDTSSSRRSDCGPKAGWKARQKARLNESNRRVSGPRGETNLVDEPGMFQLQHRGHVEQRDA